MPSAAVTTGLVTRIKTNVSLMAKNFNAIPNPTAMVLHCQSTKIMQINAPFNLRELQHKAPTVKLT